jgi:hypothetical protein
VKKIFTDWKTYRTRFLIRAHQLTEPEAFTDPLGREHRGRVGDYLVESRDGSRSITPRAIFEDIYVEMGATQPLTMPVTENKPSARGQLSNSTLKRRSPLGTASA